ncbi:MAG: hypothetical protein FXF47_05120 [Candidatus Mcinerneyibacterium aminivorans]|jgi:hypothetical protein|uniref:Uncharacterized protein n=1 Tax=Candidatus Mcinerneyibacterium aminivorans TaxID=2703815 RepID=A0A5D0MH55_9BACT|nr:MAG: hypothetical protein FXF47_05120 [Candidatus Mcinerneyibacterium aminivorans]
MGLKIVLFAVVYFISFYLVLRALEEETRKKIQTLIIYLGAFLFGTNIIIDIGWSLQNKLKIYYLIPIILFFVVFYGIIVFISYKRRG